LPISAQTRCTALSGLCDLCLRTEAIPPPARSAILDLVRLEYFDDPSLQRPVLLLYGERGIDPEAVALLRRGVEELAARAKEDGLRVESLPGFLGVDGCSLLAQVGKSNVGVEPSTGTGRSLRCGLDAAGWRRVSDLLEPFADHEQAGSRNGFQYLDESGPIDWIISRSRSW
jgi:hypothetical protein